MDKEYPSYQQLFHVSRQICDIQIANLPRKHTWRCIEAVVTRTTRNPSRCFAGCLYITRGNVNFDVLTGFKACLNDAFSNNILTATVPSFKADLQYTNRKFAMKIYLEMYRSGRNENDSKSSWLFGRGNPIFLGFKPLFSDCFKAFFGGSLLKFSPKFSRSVQHVPTI